MALTLSTRDRPGASWIALALLTLLTPTGARAGGPDNAFCPVLTDEPALTEPRLEYGERTIHFCCERCVRRFREAPEKYLKNLPPAGTAPRRPENRSGSRFAEINAFRRLPPIPAVVAETREEEGSLPYILRAAALGLAAGLTILVARSRVKRSLAEGTSTPAVWRAIGAVPLLAVCFTVATASALYVAEAHAETGRKLRYWEQLDFVHNATFHDYGYPPKPARDPRPRGLDKTYYRGNDERDERLWNNGNYRTATFHLSLVNGEGKALAVGDAIDGACLVRVHFERSANTEGSFYEGSDDAGILGVFRGGATQPAARGAGENGQVILARALKRSPKPRAASEAQPIRNPQSEIRNWHNPKSTIRNPQSAAVSVPDTLSPPRRRLDSGPIA